MVCNVLWTLGRDRRRECGICREASTRIAQRPSRSRRVHTFRISSEKNPMMTWKFFRVGKNWVHSTFSSRHFWNKLKFKTSKTSASFSFDSGDLNNELVWFQILQSRPIVEWSISWTVRSSYSPLFELFDCRMVHYLSHDLNRGQICLIFRSWLECWT